MKLKTVKTELTTNNFVDKDTGEVLETTEDIKHTKIVVADKESFVMMFTEVASLTDNLDMVSLKVIQWCALNAKHNDNTINLSDYYRKEIGKKFTLTDGTIRNAITKLKKLKALIPVGTATYRVNPKYYWKGDTTERKKTMRYILEIECLDCFDSINHTPTEKEWIKGNFKQQ